MVEINLWSLYGGGYLLFVIYFHVSLLKSGDSIERISFRFFIICLLCLIYPIFLVFLIFRILHHLRKALYIQDGEEDNK